MLFTAVKPKDPTLNILKSYVSFMEQECTPQAKDY